MMQITFSVPTSMLLVPTLVGTACPNSGHIADFARHVPTYEVENSRGWNGWNTRQCWSVPTVPTVPTYKLKSSRDGIRRGLGKQVSRMERSEQNASRINLGFDRVDAGRAAS